MSTDSHKGADLRRSNDLRTSTERPGPQSSASRGTALPVFLDRSAEMPLPVQLAGALRDAIDAATLRPGEGVPATREFATRLGVARGVVVAAYDQLRAEGYLSATHGQGTRVNPALEAHLHAGVTVHPEAGVSTASQWTVPDTTLFTTAPSSRTPLVTPTPPTDLLATTPQSGPLAPGIPITDAIDSPAWRSAWRTAAARAHLAAPALGDARLRTEIAEHLRLMRSTARSAHDVLVTAGTRDGLGLILTALGATRDRALAVGVEDPGLPSLRGVAARHGARIVALPTDAEGLDTSRLLESVLDVVIVTPSHQYPLGGSLPLPRRRELLAWARHTGVVVVEDDFDSELRYTGSPLPTLAALDDPIDGAVVLLGTFSRTIAPALSAGYLLAPAALRALIEPIRTELGGPVSTVVQEALGQYLASGELRRHTARMLRRYAARRDTVSDRLAGAKSVRVRPMDGGLHAVIEFTDHEMPERRARETRVVEQSEAAGLGAEALGRYWQHRNEGSGMAGFVIGMGGSDSTEFEAALTTLRKILG